MESKESEKDRPKLRDIGTIAMESLGKIDTVLAFELSLLNDEMKHMGQENELLKAENNTLKAKLLQQREDEADIYFYLHKKLDANYEVITQLETDIESVKREKEAVTDAYETALAVQNEQFSKEKKDWAERMESAESTLQSLELFQERKAALEETLEKLSINLESEKATHQQQMIEIERRNVQEKERIKKEMLIKIKENKQNLLAMTEDQLHTTTKRTMMENDQMISELQYQSKETEKLLAKYKTMEAEVAQLRIQIKLNKETEVEMAKRTHFYQKLIKKLNERVQADQVAAQHHQAMLSQEDASKESVNKANEVMIGLLSEKTTQLEVQLRTLSSELRDARDQLDAARAEKTLFLGEQDDTLRFLSTAIHDITHQLGTKSNATKEWSANDIVPAKLDDLGPADVKKVLQMLFRKLHTYQAKIVQLGAVKSSEKNREALEKQFGVELPPIATPPSPLDILTELANRGNAPKVLPETTSIYPSPVGQRSVASQTLPCWTEYRKQPRQHHPPPPSLGKKAQPSSPHPTSHRSVEKKRPSRFEEWPEETSFPALGGRVDDDVLDAGLTSSTASLATVQPPMRGLTKKRVVLPTAARLPT